jgi:hypothetical protein
MLLTDNDERFGFYLTGNADTNYYKSDITRRLRLKSLAETLVTMQNAGVSVYRDEKPDIFYPPNAYDEPPTFWVTTPVFYNSKEVKEVGVNSLKIKGSRFTGALLTESVIYIVYNTGDSLMKWENNFEVRTKTLLWHTLSIERMPEQYFSQLICGLMLGDTMEQAYQLLTSKSGKKQHYFKLDNTFDYFPFVTNDRYGEVLLRLICDTEKRNELDSILAVGLNPHNPGSVVENDATDENGEPVLFAYDCDMYRIKRFNSALSIHGRFGTLICFDYQEDVLRRYCSENVRIETIDFDKFEKKFFP